MEMEEMMMMNGGGESIYKIARKIKRKELSLYNALHSIDEDAGFVSEIRNLYSELPLLANLRCGLWYARKFDATCYFKSTDGHTGNWSFNPTRLNMHVALTAGEKGGCMIVDATRKGKRFPDSMSKTIPIWACVLNRGIGRIRNLVKNEEEYSRWDCELHLPLWVSGTEKSRIEKRLEEWVEVLLAACWQEVYALSNNLKKPLRSLWISQKSVIWLNEVADVTNLEFTPLILISASKTISVPQRISDGDFSWNYIAGAADDEESWSHSLSPSLFWEYSSNILTATPDECIRKVAEIVEKDRVYRALHSQQSDVDNISSKKTSGVYWIGNSGLAVANARYVEVEIADSVIDCMGLLPLLSQRNNNYLNLEIVASKLDHFSLQRQVAKAIEFAWKKLQVNSRVIVCCDTGEDISVCVCLAIHIRCFNKEGEMMTKKKKIIGNQEQQVTKWDVKQRLVYLCTYVINARPCRHSLRQVYNFLIQK